MVCTVRLEWDYDGVAIWEEEALEWASSGCLSERRASMGGLVMIGIRN
jgi:hypothetical protein